MSVTSIRCCQVQVALHHDQGRVTQQVLQRVYVVPLLEIVRRKDVCEAMGGGRCSHLPVLCRQLRKVLHQHAVDEDVAVTDTTKEDAVFTIV